MLGVVTIIHLVLIEDVAERIPVGRSLHRHVDGVVGVTHLVGFILTSGDGIGACGQHGVNWVPAPAEQAALRSAAIERNAHAEDFAFPDELGCRGDMLRRDKIQCPDLIILAPSAPIRKLFVGLGDGGLADVDFHFPIP